jgi:ankyrin repeat protein
MEQLEQIEKLITNVCLAGDITTLKIIFDMSERHLICNKGLIAASGVGDEKMVDFLLNNGANDFDSALFMACEKGQIKTVRYFITFHIDDSDIIQQGLDIAKKYNHSNVIEYLTNTMNDYIQLDKT